MDKKPIAITLKRLTGALNKNDYQIVKVVNAVTIWSPVLRHGDIVDETLARQLARSYRVTIK